MKLSLATGLFLCGTLLFACSQESKQPAEKEEQKKQLKEAGTDYIPVTDFIQGEIAKIDSLPVGILKREIKGNASDSAFIKPEEFKRLASAFLPQDLNKETFQRSFSESSFFDQTTEALTFTYEATDASLTVRRVDVLMPTGQELAGQIKSVYMEKNYSSGDTAIKQKLLWKAGSNFSIITTKDVPGRQTDIQQVKVIWDPLAY